MTIPLPRMRCCAGALLAACALPATAAAPDAPTAVNAMLNAGARELALKQVEALQPSDVNAPRWAEWEAVRCEALARLARYDALLARVSALSPERNTPQLNPCFAEASRAALAMGNPELARAYAARLLWQEKAPAGDVRAVRLTVIESYLAQQRGDEAFAAMLRFQQDYRPLAREVTERFAEALLDLGRDSQALNWLPQSDEITPARLKLQLRSGALAPDAVIAQARAAFVRESDPGYWRAIFEAATRAGDASVKLEALERLLQTANADDAEAQARAAQRLWDAYLATAAEVGNREQLLMGDDAAWAAHAAGPLAADPFLARAFNAYLTRRAQNPDIRRKAQLDFAYSLYSAGLDNAALRAMQRIGLNAESLDAETRYLLGTIAAKHNDAALALNLWNGVPTPANVNAIEWQLTLARTALQAGEASQSAQTVKALLAGRTSISRELAQRVLEIGQEMLDLRTVEAAQTVYALVVPLSTDAHAREALFGLGRAYELAGEPVSAAAYYLRSALLVQAEAPDALAFQARLLAGLSLMRAGLRDDARAQFEWLLKNSRDPALTEAARRGLNRL